MVQRPRFSTSQEPPARRPDESGLCAASLLTAPRASSEQQRSKVGFPIRRFTDQSLFAAPHDLSQRTTSFIASQRQGIHQIPLRHLIALIAKARALLRSIDSVRLSQRAPWLEKTSFASNASGDLKRSGFFDPRLVAQRAELKRNALSPPGSLEPVRDASPHPALDRMRFLFTMSDTWKTQKRRRRPFAPAGLPGLPTALSAHPARKGETDKTASEGHGVAAGQDA